MSFGMTSITTESGSSGHTGALFEGLCVPADSAAVLKRSTPKGAPLLAGIALVLARRLEEAIKKAAGFRILAGPV